MFAASILFAALVSAVKPIALFGTPAEAVRIRCNVLDPMPARAELIANKGRNEDVNPST